MSLNIVDSEPQVSRAEVSEFERGAGYNLPHSYVSFLLQNNGGKPGRATFQIAGYPLNPLGRVHYFFGLKAAFESYDLQKVSESFRVGIPSGLLPIACTAGSDYVCLYMRNRQSGVVYWDQRHYWSTGEWRESDLYEIAPSFEALITMMEKGPYGPA